MLRTDFEVYPAKEHGIYKCYQCNIEFGGSGAIRQHNLLVHNENSKVLPEMSNVMETKSGFVNNDTLASHSRLSYDYQEEQTCIAVNETSQEEKDFVDETEVDLDDIEIKDELLESS